MIILNRSATKWKIICWIVRIQEKINTSVTIVMITFKKPFMISWRHSPRRKIKSSCHHYPSLLFLILTRSKCLILGSCKVTIKGHKSRSFHPHLNIRTLRWLTTRRKEGQLLKCASSILTFSTSQKAAKIVIWKSKTMMMTFKD